MSLTLDPYGILKAQKDEIFPLVKFEFKSILTKVKRRLTVRQSLRNPWRVLVKHDIHHKLFYAWFRSVRDHIPQFGRVVEINAKEWKVTFTNINSFIFHLSKALDGSNNGAKVFVNRDCPVKLVASDDDPIRLPFYRQKNQLIISGRYIVLNCYGNAISC